MPRSVPSLPWVSPLHVAIVVVCIAGVLTAAFVQHTVVLGTTPVPRFFIVPAFVGTGFGLLIVGFRRALVMKRRLAEALEARQETIEELNRGLEARVEARTQELAAKQEQLLRSQQLDLIGQLTLGVAHDLNNVLAVIRMCLEAANLRTDPEGVRSLLGTVGDATDRGQRLTRQLLATSRRTPGSERLPLQEVAEPLVSMLNRAFGSRHELVLEGEKVTAEVDVARVEQILLNLIVNARDALSDGGKIQVILGAGERDGGEMLSMAVKDNGHGIPEEVRDRIFEPFVTTKAAGKGTGLGLATVRTLVQEVEGSIDVDSGPQGTVFEVMLPRDADTDSAR